jgi:hypothetical protein
MSVRGNPRLVAQGTKPAGRLNIGTPIPQRLNASETLVEQLSANAAIEGAGGKLLVFPRSAFATQASVFDELGIINIVEFLY